MRETREPGSSPAGAQRFFVLCAPSGQTFEVIVMLVGPHDNSSVDMVFVPIPVSEPRIVYDGSDYLFNMTSPAISSIPTGPTTYPGNCVGFNLCVTTTITPQIFTRANLTVDHSTEDDILLNYSGRLTFATVAIGVNATDITGDYNATSENYANWLYQSDAKSAQDWVAAQQTTTTTATITSQTQPSNSYNWWSDSSVSRFVIAIWGSWLGLVGFLIFVVVFIFAISKKGVRQAIKERLPKV